MGFENSLGFSRRNIFYVTMTRVICVAKGFLNYMLIR
jgi:hypothetical protein